MKRKVQENDENESGTRPKSRFQQPVNYQQPGDFTTGLPLSQHETAK